MVRLPVRLGGFGFRSHEDTAPLAILGALEQAVPAFQGAKGICPQIAEVLGGEDCIGEEAGGDRWRVILSSGCREREELRRSWN